MKVANQTQIKFKDSSLNKNIITRIESQIKHQIICFKSSNQHVL